METLNARTIIHKDLLESMIPVLNVKKELSAKIAKELTNTEYIQVTERESSNEIEFRARLHVISQEEYEELIRLKNMMSLNWIQDRNRKAVAFDEIVSDSKMDVYDFELGEYVLDVIKRYESNND